MLRTIEKLRNHIVELHDAPARFVELRYAGGNKFLFKDVSDVVTYREAYEAERILREKTEAFLNLAGAAAHEMNQPLTIIQGNIELILRNAPDHIPTDMRSSLDDLKESATRMAEIVKMIGHARKYQTKPYVGKTEIVDLEASSREE
jgi:signal transduction histidine kinase